MRAFRVAGLALIAAIAAATVADRAETALFFVFRPTAAEPGELIALRTPHTPWSFVWRDGVRPRQRPIPLYLVSNSIAKDVSSVDDPRLHHIGSIILDKNGRGVLRFNLPTLPRDRYAVAGVCVQCAPYSRGSTFFVLPVDERNTAAEWRPRMLLRVEAASPAAPATKDANRRLPLWALAAVGGLGAGLVVWARRRREIAARSTSVASPARTPPGFTSGF
jgi:hypothetical protein